MSKLLWSRWLEIGVWEGLPFVEVMERGHWKSIFHHCVDGEAMYTREFWRESESLVRIWLWEGFMSSRGFVSACRNSGLVWLSTVDSHGFPTIIRWSKTCVAYFSINISQSKIPNRQQVMRKPWNTQYAIVNSISIIFSVTFLDHVRRSSRVHSNHRTRSFSSDSSSMSI